MLIAIVPLVVAIIGLLMWVISIPRPPGTGNPLLVEIGKILFIIGAFWTVYALSGQTIRL